MNDIITVETFVQVPCEKAWELFTNPAHIVRWNAASDDWHTVNATNDLTVGATFGYRMEAKDGSAGFDLKGTYTEIIPCEKLTYTLEDGRHVGTSFSTEDGQTRIVTSFEPEMENSHAMQQGGWQAILDNFKKYAEAQ